MIRFRKESIMAIRYFKGIEKDIQVEFNGLTGISVPEYVNRARKRFSFDQDSGILHKQCPRCEDWFPVERLTKDGTWEDIHSEEVVHYDGKAFRSDCNHCYKQKRSGKSGKPSSTGKSANAEKPSNSDMKKVSVFLSPDDLKYLKICAAYFETTVGNVLSDIIAKDRKVRKIDC